MVDNSAAVEMCSRAMPIALRAGGRSEGKIDRFVQELEEVILGDYAVIDMAAIERGRLLTKHLISRAVYTLDMEI